VKIDNTADGDYYGAVYGNFLREQPEDRLTAAREVLRLAQDKIRSQADWCRGSWARTKSGAPADPTDGDAAKWCAVGALRTAGATYWGEAHQTAWSALQLAVWVLPQGRIGDAIPTFNDTHDHTDVMDAYDLAGKFLDDPASIPV
jgi:hypothetical protein